MADRPSDKPADRWGTWEKRLRDLVIFVVAIGGMINELFFQQEPRPTILLFLTGVLGLPFALRADEKRREDKA